MPKALRWHSFVLSIGLYQRVRGVGDGERDAAQLADRANPARHRSGLGNHYRHPRRVDRLANRHARAGDGGAGGRFTVRGAATLPQSVIRGRVSTSSSTCAVAMGYGAGR